MALVLETMSAFTTILKGSARPTNYQTLPTSDDERPIAHGDERQRGGGEKHDSAVYLSFWLFGAGTLLGWNGPSIIPPSSTPHVSMGRDKADLRYSINVYVPSVGFVLPARIEDWAKPTQSSIYSVLFRPACIPRLCSRASRTSKPFYTYCLCQRGMRTY